MANSEHGDSRTAILRALRAAHVDVPPLPELPVTGVRYPDVHAQFAQSLAGVGGRCVAVDDGDIESALLGLPVYAAAAHVLSLVPGVGKANVNIAAIIDPTELAGVDVCVLPGRLGVAENGAVWVTEDDFPFRAGWFLAQHMVLIVDPRTIVHNLHEAYERIHIGARGFSTFISGPSKTADIEQSLVIGAQGPRSCTVLLVDSKE